MQQSTSFALLLQSVGKPKALFCVLIYKKPREVGMHSPARSSFWRLRSLLCQQMVYECIFRIRGLPPSICLVPPGEIGHLLTPISVYNPIS